MQIFRGSKAREQVQSLREVSQKEMWRAAAKLVIEPRSPTSHASDPHSPGPLLRRDPVALAGAAYERHCVRDVDWVSTANGNEL